MISGPTFNIQLTVSESNAPAQFSMQVPGIRAFRPQVALAAAFSSPAVGGGQP
jgi:hypothetical protein